MARAESRHGERGAAEGGGGYGGSEDEYEDEYEDEHEDNHEDEHENSGMENPEALLARTEIGREMAERDPETYRGLVRGMEPGTGAEDMPWLGRDEERARREWERLERSFHQITGPWEEQPGGQARM